MGITIVKNSLFKKAWVNTAGRAIIMQLIVIRNKMTSVLSKMDDGTSGGNSGVCKMTDKICKWFCWLHLHHDKEEWCSSCEIYAKSKHS